MNDLLQFLEEKGFTGFEPILNGTIQRFDREGSQTGWFCGSYFKDIDFIKADVGDWKTGETYNYSTIREFDAEENKLIQAKIKEHNKLKDQAREKETKEASKVANDKWASANTGNESPYLTSKGFDAGITERLYLRTSKSSWGSIDLLVPCRDIEGTLWGLQKIQEDGSKFFQPGQRIKACFHQLGQLTPETKKIFLAEGIATAASIFIASNTPTFCCFNAGNLSLVAEALRKKYPSMPMIICGDDDRFTMVRGEYQNPGKIEAEKAASLCQGIAIYPKFSDQSSRGTDFNDLHVAEGLNAVNTQLNNITPPNPKEILKTQGTGFHTVHKTATGKITYTPNYKDLKRYFEKLHPYRMLNHSGICYVWSGKHYSDHEKIYLDGFAETHFNPPADNKKCIEFRNLIARTNFTLMEWFDQTTERKTNFQNGVLNNDNLIFGPHTPEIGFRYVLKYNYDPKAECPHFDKFLHDITRGDESLQLNLLEFAGYALSNDNLWLHKALVLEGQGSNGKSTFMTVLRELAGQDNCSAFTLSDLKEEGNRQSLDGKLFNMTEETPSRSLNESSIFKNLVGGGVVNARQLYKTPYTFKNRAKIIFACNDMPETSDTSHGYLRRLMIVPFRARFSSTLGNKDPYIENKLLKELPGIFNKVFHAYRKTRERGDFTPSLARDEAIATYQRDIDFTLDWVEKTLQLHPMGNGMDNKVSPISKIYVAYKMDMETQGFKPVHSKIFGKKLVRAVQDYEQRYAIKKIDGKTERVLIATTRESGEHF